MTMALSDKIFVVIGDDAVENHQSSKNLLQGASLAPYRYQNTKNKQNTLKYLLTFIPI